MSPICQTFVQNAWRSDLCSNCFKCVAEHSDSRNNRDRMATPRYMPQATSLYQSRGISSTLKWRLSEPIYERIARRDFGSQTPSKANHEPDNSSRGILVKSTPEKKPRSRPSVDFASEEALVIGYGGNDYDSDQSPWEMASDDESIDLDLLDENDEDRKISRLTKNNTEFNSSNKNLESTKEDCINNNKNMVTTTPPKALTCVTYNDIQPQKKLNQYYFSTKMEPLKSYLHNDASKQAEAKVDNVRKAVDDNCRNLLNDDFTPLNTRTYSFVSELNKTTASEHSSDSDYSTCRLTAGDSTDSESFQDAEEPRIVPCSSFLHGSFPRKLQQQPSLNSLDSDKKYDGGSSTSGDVSNLSDDSDTIESTERTFKSRTTRSAKTVSDIKKVGAHENDEPKASEVTTKVSGSVKTSSPPSKLEASDPKQKKESIYVSIDVQQNSKPKTDHSSDKTEPPLPPNPPVEVNLRNIIAVNESVSSPPEAKSSPPRSTKSVDPPQKNVRKPAPVKEQVSRTSSAPSTVGIPKPQIAGGTQIADSIAGTQIVDKTPSDDDEGSPEAINNRQSKLAALALELELARRDSEIKSGKVPPPPPSLPAPPPEVKAKCSLRTTTATPSSFPTIKKGGGITCTSRLSTLPDVLQESPSPAGKIKKNRFSLKKLLKRSKDSGTFAPANKEVNPKAWKKQTFDRNRLSLEIVHPMDLSSGDSTPTEEGQYSAHPNRGALRGGYNRARSLSALPQLIGDDQDSSVLDGRQVDTLPTRKAGTVAERKKNRPSLVRTPSCSALPNRPTVTIQDRTPPPKPPPPPKCMQPPPPPPHQARKPPSCSPARPPPPKIPETKSRIQSGDSPKREQQDSSNSDKEYANLGDIRSVMTPKKPQRPSAVSVSRDSSDGSKRRPDDFYETLLHAEDEEDHYTYLDDAEVKAPKSQCKVVKDSPSSSPQTNGSARGRPWLDLQTSYAAIAAANYESLAEIITTSMNEGAECFQRGGKSLRWKDFSVDEGEPQTIAGNRSIYNATYKHKEIKVLLMVTPKQTSHQNAARNQVRYPVLANFSDYVPKDAPSEEWSTVYILQHSRITSVSDFADRASSSTSDQHLHLRDHCFVLLQLIHTLKVLQAEGIEDIHCDLRHLVLVATQEDKPPVLVLFPEDKTHLSEFGPDRKTLCQATLDTMYHFLRIQRAEDLDSCLVNGDRLSGPVAHTFKAIAKVLAEEKASSLSQAKGFLEYMLWGPVDVRVSDATDVLDAVLQRWLDLQRAQMVKSTISQIQQKTRLDVYEEYQLVFLIQASVKSLKSVISKL